MIIGAVAALLILAAGGWYWWSTKRIEWYGGVQPFMQKLQTLQKQTAAELARSEKLPEDFEQMEQLSQDAQDITAVFMKWKDPHEKDPRFGPLVVELTRQAGMLEHNWDNGTRDQAKASFEALTRACNACHQQLAAGKPPVISPEPKAP